MSGEELPPGMLEFLQEYYRIESELTELLDLDLSGSREPNPMELRLASRYDTLREMALAEDYRAGLRLARLGLLVENLRILDVNRPEILADFRKAFHEIEHDRYFGWRCEVDTAGFLAKQGIEFAHPDPPDFTFEWKGERISIECTSGHYRGSSIGIEDKLKGIISKKATEEYIDPSTVLIVDVTNVYHNAVSRNEEFDSGDLKRWVRERVELESADIGSVLLLGYIGQLEGFRLQQATDRVDLDPSEGLQDFLQEHFAFGEGERKMRWFPPEP